MSKDGTEDWVKDGCKKVLDIWKAWYYMPVQMGMGAGGIPDFVTCVPIKITPDMVGKTVGLFVGVETKERGMIETLRRQHANGGKHAHMAKDGEFISNRPLQQIQADAIHDAHGQCWVIDHPVQLASKLGVLADRVVGEKTA